MSGESTADTTTTTIRKVKVPVIPPAERREYMAFHVNSWPTSVEEAQAALVANGMQRVIWIQDATGRVVIPVGRFMIRTSMVLPLRRNKIRRGFITPAPTTNNPLAFNFSRYAPEGESPSFTVADVRSDKKRGVLINPSLSIVGSMLVTGQGGAGKTAFMWSIYRALAAGGAAVAFLRANEPEGESEAVDVAETIGWINWHNVTGASIAMVETIKAEFYVTSLPESGTPSEAGAVKGGAPGVTLQEFLSDLYAASEWAGIDLILSGLPASDDELAAVYRNMLKMHAPELLELTVEGSPAPDCVFAHRAQLHRSRFRAQVGDVVLNYTGDALMRSRTMRALALAMEGRKEEVAQGTSAAVRPLRPPPREYKQTEVTKHIAL